MSNLLRFQVVEEAFKKKAVEVPTPSERPSEYFGKMCSTVRRCISTCLPMSMPS